MGAKALELPRGKFTAFFFIFEGSPSCKNEKEIRPICDREHLKTRL